MVMLAGSTIQVLAAAAMRRARASAPVPGVGHGGRAAGALHLAEGGIEIFRGVSRRRFDLDLPPVGVDLVGKHGGDAGVGALAEFDVLGNHRDSATGRDAQERIGNELRLCVGCGGVRDGQAHGDDETGGGGAL
jgi:hypothetical protein